MNANKLKVYMVRFRGIEAAWMIIAHNEVEALLLMPGDDMQGIIDTYSGEEAKERFSYTILNTGCNVKTYLTRVGREYAVPASVRADTPGLVMSMHQIRRPDEH